MMNLEDYWSRFLRIIESEGWAVQSVFGADDSLPFSYTVGLSAQGFPELILVGIGAQTATHLLNTAAARLRDGSFSGRADEPLERVANATLIPKDVKDDPAWTARMATRYAAQLGHSVRLVQLVYPDRAGKFPWDEGCDPRMIANQDLDAIVARQQAMETALANSPRNGQRPLH